ncbi:hypothetical protein BC941DRAFT_351162 [Chlamydoabsidia padenii]|nr:hypothetical protein BC941DRAFT_351162 [Chlamydoabsidia padenii]
MKCHGHDWTLLEYNEFFLVKLYQAKYQDILTMYNGDNFASSGVKLSPGSFNAILATYIKLDREQDAGQLIKESMERWGLMPDIRDFERSMHRCLPRDAEVVAKGREWIARYGFDQVKVVDTNLHHLFREKRVDDAIWVYECLNKSNMPLELSTCTILIKNLMDANKPRLVVDIYDDMLRRGLKSNPIICSAMLTLFALRRKADRAEQAVRNMVMAGHPMDEVIYNQLIKVYFKTWNIRKALQAFDEVQRHPDLKVNEIILNTVVDGLVMNREIQAAHHLYKQILANSATSIKPDMVTFNTLFKGFVNAKEYGLAGGVIQDMYKYQCEPDTVTYTTLINSIFEFKQPKTTNELMGYVKSMGMTPNIYTFNAMINGWVGHGNMDEAERTLQLLKSSPYQLTPTIHTMTNMIQGYVQVFNLPKAMQTFQDCISQGIKPDRAAYNFLITGFMDHDRIDHAIVCLQHMRKANLNPTKSTWTLLIDKCVKNQLWQAGAILVKEIENSDFQIINTPLRLPNELILYILRQFLDLGDVWRLLQVSRQLRQFAIDTIHKRWKIELVFTPETAMKIQCRAALIALEDVSCQLSLHTRPTTNTPRFNGTDFLLATTDCDNKLVHDLMLKEERLHQRIIRGISSYKHKYVLIEDIDIRNRIRATVDVIFHHAVFVSALSRPHLVCPNSNNRSLAAMMVRLLTRLDAAFPSYCREITYTLADHIKAFLEYTGYKLLAQRPTCDPFGPQQAPLLVSTLHTIAACFDLMGAAFVGKILGETHVECAVQRTCELLSDDRHLLGLVKKALLVDLLENWLTNKRGLVAGELCRMVRSEIEACSRQQLLLVQQQQQGGRVSSFFMEQDHSRYQQRQDQDSFLYRPSSLHTRYQLS